MKDSAKVLQRQIPSFVGSLGLKISQPKDPSEDALSPLIVPRPLGLLFIIPAINLSPPTRDLLPWALHVA
jgi:hypothetical protein